MMDSQAAPQQRQKTLDLRQSSVLRTQPRERLAAEHLHAPALTATVSLSFSTQLLAKILQVCFGLAKQLSSDAASASEKAISLDNFRIRKPS